MHKNLIILLIFIFLPINIVFGIEQININTASLAELDKLTGIGPKYAQTIINARPFSSVDELDRVKGIGPATLAKIKTQGLACVNCVSIIIETPKTETPKVIEVAPMITYPSGVFISEIMPNPIGADETEEWIKLFNTNNFNVDLSGWKITDTNGTSTTFVFPKDSKILANNFLTLKRTDTKIMLNNDADGINLLTPDNKIINSVNFTKAPLGQTYKKTTSGWTWSDSQKPLPKAKKPANSKLSEVGVASISQSINQDETNTTNPWFLFYIVLAVAILSASIILFIKLKSKKYVRT